MGGPPAWELGEVLTLPHRKNVSFYEMFTKKNLGAGLILWYDLRMEYRLRYLFMYFILYRLL